MVCTAALTQRIRAEVAAGRPCWRCMSRPPLSSPMCHWHKLVR
ncbi:hypothetical protein I553_7782 [Mycobacterium xenopi 4042]|uniref:Uncharacterized protein n=1 Tax=Mycobacterium xenopi 4042 TaxID=1299334 RepID=X8ANA1_MYCXE|nr:hypothetical protein I553_7782 [Mycobacterium xenopi 4042]